MKVATEEGDGVTEGEGLGERDRFGRGLGFEGEGDGDGLGEGEVAGAASARWLARDVSGSRRGSSWMRTATTNRAVPPSFIQEAPRRIPNHR